MSQKDTVKGKYSEMVKHKPGTPVPGCRFLPCSLVKEERSGLIAEKLSLPTKMDWKTLALRLILNHSKFKYLFSQSCVTLISVLK